MAKSLTPKELAAELKIDPKKLRGYLRKNHARKADQHNTSWTIDTKTANAARNHFKGNKPAKAAPKKAKRTKSKAAPKPVVAQTQAAEAPEASE